MSSRLLQAISLNSANGEMYSNRAACYIKLKNFKDALPDATRAADIKKSSKSYKRLATVHQELGNVCCLHVVDVTSVLAA